MAAESYPFDGMPSVIDNECYTAQETRQLHGSVVCTEGVDTFTGLRVTESAVPAMSVLVSAGGGWMLNDEGTCEGPYHVQACDPTTVVIDANSSGSTRFDAIWLRTCDSQYSAAGSGGSIYYSPGGATSTDPTTAVVPTDDCSYYLLAIIQVTNGETAINGTPNDFGLTETDVTDTRNLRLLCGPVQMPYTQLDASGSTAVPNSGANTKIALATTTHLDAASFSVTSSVITVLEGGLYDINAWAIFASGTAGFRTLALTKNGTATLIVTNTVASVTDLQASPTVLMIPLAAGDTVQLIGSQTGAAGNLNVSNGRLLIRKVG